MTQLSNPMARRLRRLAQERGLSLARVARRGGFTPSNLLVWARGWPKNVTGTTERVARALGVSVEVLTYGVEHEPVTDVHEDVLMAVRLTDKDAIAALKELDPGWEELIKMERNWRVSEKVRVWMRRRLARLNEMEFKRCQDSSRKSTRG